MRTMLHLTVCFQGNITHALTLYTKMSTSAGIRFRSLPRSSLRLNDVKNDVEYNRVRRFCLSSLHNFKAIILQELKRPSQSTVTADTTCTDSAPSCTYASVLEDPAAADYYSSVEDHKERCWYFAMVCHYSSWPWIQRGQDKKSSTVHTNKQVHTEAWKQFAFDNS